MNEEIVKRKLKSYIALAQKSGKLISGEESCEKALRNGKARLMLICADASENTKKKFSQKAFYYNCPYLEIFDRAWMAGATGRENRASFAVADEGFAQKISECILQIKEVKDKNNGTPLT